MIIPLKHSGYRAGIRLYPIGGGDDGTGDVAPVVTPPPARLPTAAPPPQFTTYGQGDRTGSLVRSGNSYRPSTLDYSRPIYDPNYADNITGYQDSSQFNQPIYQQQYQNYNRGNSMNVSQYGQPTPFYGGGYGGRYGGGDGYPDGNFRTQPYIDPSTGRHTGLADIPQMQGPFSYQQPMQQQMQSPFSYQQPMQQQYQPQQYQQQYQSQQYQPQQYQPQQMQTPFSYQQPMAQRTSSGPSQAIVGRSSQMRGTPNVMRRAEGGIASLLDNDE